MDFKSKIRNIPDFPEKGVIFRDIAPLIEDGDTFVAAIDELYNKVKHLEIDKVVGIDARGFIIAGAIAYKLKSGLVMLRKKGKLPFKTKSIEYDLEYGKNTLEIHRDSINPGERILIVDDVLATGGTVDATVRLVERLKGTVVGIAFIIVLDYLQGRKKLKNYPIYSLVSYT